MLDIVDGCEEYFQNMFILEYSLQVRNSRTRLCDYVMHYHVRRRRYLYDATTAFGVHTHCAIVRPCQQLGVRRANFAWGAFTGKSRDSNLGDLLRLQVS